MRIGEIAARSRVPAKTIRFWEDQRVLPRPARSPAGHRDYDIHVIDRLAFVRRAQAAGFALHQIRQVLDIADSGSPTCRHVSDLIDGRLAEVEARIAELEAARDHLRELAQRAALQNPADCHGYCSILQPQPGLLLESRDVRRPGRG